MTFEVGKFYIHTFEDKQQLVVHSAVHSADPRPYEMTIITLPLLIPGPYTKGKSFRVKDENNYKPFTSFINDPFVILKNEGKLTLITTDPEKHQVFNINTGALETIISDRRYKELVKENNKEPYTFVTADMAVQQSQSRVCRTLAMHMFEPLTEKSKRQLRREKTQVLRQEIFSMSKEFYK